jgi:hypothetical protein
MRAVVVLLSVLLMAACASGSGAPSKYTGTRSMAGRAHAMSDDEVARYVADLSLDRLQALCGAHRSMTAQRGCARDAMLRGFDTTGEAKRHCDPNLDLKETVHCVLMGTLGYEIALAAGMTADDYNWSDSSAGLKEAGSKLARKHFQECGPRANACILEKLSRTLNVSQQQVAICTDETELKESVGCVLRVHLVDVVESAVARMGQGEVET